MRIRLLTLLLAPLLAGCLPYACNRVESRAISPADSLSRAFAARVPVDTLTSNGDVTRGFEHPRTVGFGPGGGLWVTDTGSHTLVRLGADAIQLDTLQYPYLAGFRDGMPVVFSPSARWLAALNPETGSVVWRAKVPPSAAGGGALEYAVVADSVVAFKGLAQDTEGFIAQFKDGGWESTPLPGPYWTYAGLLREVGGEVWSLSGYRPLVHRVDASGRLDSLALFGFDSPMLARSRSFMRGDLKQPPLLSASAAVADSLLFVLNMRPGWLRIDVFGLDGRLRHALVQPDPSFNRDYYPTDLAVRRDGSGFDIAVAVLEPEPGVARFRWQP